MVFFLPHPNELSLDLKYKAWKKALISLVYQTLVIC